MKFITGQQKIMNEIMMRRDRYLREVGDAAEKGALDVANHAKSGHEGEMAHADNRYQNRTGTLTRSITPELAVVNYKKVQSVVYSNVEYAPLVELGVGNRRPYPYLFPALVAMKGKVKDRFARIKK